MASALPYAPTPCTFDGRGLFTHGEFRCYQSQNPCLSLFTHGEFPRAVVAVVGGAQPGVGNAGRRRAYKPEVIPVCRDDEAIVIALLMAVDDDDDWW